MGGASRGTNIAPLRSNGDHLWHAAGSDQRYAHLRRAARRDHQRRGYCNCRRPASSADYRSDRSRWKHRRRMSNRDHRRAATIKRGNVTITVDRMNKTITITGTQEYLRNRSHSGLRQSPRSARSIVRGAGRRSSKGRTTKLTADHRADFSARRYTDARNNADQRRQHSQSPRRDKPVRSIYNVLLWRRRHGPPAQHGRQWVAHSCT